MSTEIQPFLRVMLDASFAHVPQHEREALEAMACHSQVRIGTFHGQVTWGVFMMHEGSAWFAEWMRNSLGGVDYVFPSHCDWKRMKEGVA